MFKPDTLRELAGGSLKVFNFSLLLAFAEALLIALPYGLFYLILLDILSPEPDFMTQMTYLGLCVLTYIARFFVSKKLFLESNFVAFGLGYELRQKLTQHLKNVPVGYLNQTISSGSVTNVLCKDLDQTEHLFAHLLARILSTVAILILFSIGLFFQDWRLAVAMLSTLPLAITAYLLSRRFARHWNQVIQSVTNKLNDAILEYMQGLKVLKSYQMTGKAFRRLDEQIETSRNLSLKAEVAGGLPAISFNLLAESGFPILLITMMYLTMNNAISLPVLLLFMVVSLRFFKPLLSLAMFMAELDYIQLAAERVRSVMSAPVMDEGNNREPLKNTGLTFDNVSFHYNSKQNTLNEISFEMKPGTITAIVGPSGSGKSTVAQLLMRFWDPVSGQVLAGQRCLKDMPLEFWLSHISLVSQDVRFFPDTVHANLVIAKPDASDEEVYEACQKARIHDVIMALPEGYQTRIGDGGTQLSGGEFQRLSIARALLKDASILILDEATASLDVENELAIQQAIDEIAKDRILLVIAHRLSNVVQADQILVMQDGNITERGRHQDLLESNGLYARLWSLQQDAKGWKMATA